jgi:DNA replication protein DnaC
MVNLTANGRWSREAGRIGQRSVTRRWQGLRLGRWRAAIGHQALRNGLLVFYRSIFDVVHDLTENETMNGSLKGLSRYLKPDLLIIDDMGLKQLPKKSGEYLFEIIMRRYENRSTIMTSNRPIEEWGKLIGDVPSATAILDRFLHHAEIIKITGRSYRLKDRATPKAALDKESKE